MNLSSRTIALWVSLLLIGSLLYFFSDIVAYVCIAWVLSMIGQPLMRFFQTRIRVWKFSPGPNFSAVLTLLTFFLVIFLMIRLFVPPIVEQFNNLAGVDYGKIASALQEPLDHLHESLEKYGVLEPTPVTGTSVETDFFRLAGTGFHQELFWGCRIGGRQYPGRIGVHPFHYLLFPERAGVVRQFSGGPHA